MLKKKGNSTKFKLVSDPEGLQSQRDHKKRLHQELGNLPEAKASLAKNNLFFSQFLSQR